MSYQHDVFISYRREAQWTHWARDMVKPNLQSFLSDHFDESPDIFIDERLDVGGDWAKGLGEHLARSKVVIAILSRSYFASPWCVCELDCILSRMDCKVGLFVPVLVADCSLPDPIGLAQPIDFAGYRIPHIPKDTSTYLDFQKAVKGLAANVAALVEQSPGFDPNWVTGCVDRFNQVYQAGLTGKSVPPDCFKLPDLTPPRAPPRLRP